MKMHRPCSHKQARAPSQALSHSTTAATSGLRTSSRRLLRRNAAGARLLITCHVASSHAIERADHEQQLRTNVGPLELQLQQPQQGLVEDQLQTLPSQELTAYLERLAQGTKHMFRDAQGKLSLKNFTRYQLEQWCMSIGESPKRALQIWRWMYADGNWVKSLTDTLGQQNGISSKFVNEAGSTVCCDGGLELLQVTRSQDGTRKLVFKLTGGEAAGGTVETVLIPVIRTAGQRARITVCVSTQVGCAMNCQFCYTGRMGLLGNLTTAQIVEQVVEARRFMASEKDTTPVTNLVFMGMGEPLHNAEAVADAIEIVCCGLGLHMSHNKVTVSTVGLIPEMKRFVPRSRAQLTVSLHATTDKVRDWIVPINRRYPLKQLIETLRELFPSPPSNHTVTHVSTHNTVLSPSDDSNSSGIQLEAGTVSSSTEGQQPQQTIQQQSHYVTTTASVRKARRRRGPQIILSSNETHGVSGTQGDDSQQHTEDADNQQSMHSSLLIAYTMLRGINDTPEDAHRLLQLLEGIAAKVNLIVFNPHEGTHFLPSDNETVLAFRSILVQGGRVCTIRCSRGDDEMAACGQLGDIGLSWKPAPLIEPPARFKALIEQQQAELKAMKLGVHQKNGEVPAPAIA